VKRYSTEAWVGLFTLLGLATALYMVYRTGDLHLRKSARYPVYVDFTDVAGVAAGDVVRVAGVDVGTVAQIELRENKGRLELSIDNAVVLYQDATATVKTYGLIGNRFIAVDPGHPNFPQIQPRGEIRESHAPEDLDILVRKLSGVADDIKGVTENMKRVFGGEKGEKALQEVLENTRTLSQELVRIVKENQEHFKQIATHVAALTGELSGMVAENREAVRKTMSTLPATAENLQGITEDTRQLLKAHREDISETIRELRLASARLDESLKNVEEISRKINQGEGSLGKLINDQELYNEAKNTLKEARHLIENLREQAPISAFIAAGGAAF
jgi:phospholipid/cholesterol/gamma-HCH transport system substrate-binding protein